MISKRVIPCVLLLCVGLAAATLLAEMFMRVSGVWIARHSDHMFALMQYDEILGWKMKPNLQTTMDMFDVENIPVHTNSIGLWDKEFSTEKSAGKLRIALLGDSFTWGYGVYENQRFGNILEDSHTRYECMNFGIPAYGTDQALLMWKHVASAYRPDLVILTIYNNDYMDNLSSVLWGRPKPYFELNTAGTLELRNVPVPKTNFWDNGILHEIAPPSAALFSAPVTRRSRIADWLVKHSDVVRAISTVIFPSGRVATAASSPVVATFLTPVQETQVQLLGALIQELAGDVARKNARLLIVLAGEFSALYAAQTKGFDAVGIPYVDATTGVLAQEMFEAANAIYFSYNQHWTVAAHRAVANLVHRKILQLYTQGS